jgi:phosphatidate cytidylyltransferase
MISLVYIINFQSWQLVILLLLVVNFGMDSGAWFFGKSFGKHKLWPAVSPNKTIEGLLGGMLTSGLCGYGMYLLVFDKKNYWTIIIFSLLGLLSQIGDLVQSKLKRQYGIKDSSSLIPGHGGVYDRIDSLVFVLPFFVVTLYYYY